MRVGVVIDIDLITVKQILLQPIIILYSYSTTNTINTILHRLSIPQPIGLIMNKTLLQQNATDRGALTGSSLLHQLRLYPAHSAEKTYTQTKNEDMSVKRCSSIGFLKMYMIFSICVQIVFCM